MRLKQPTSRRSRLRALRNLAGLVLWLACLGAATVRGAISTNQDVLILNSYHPGYAWGDQEIEGFTQTIQKARPGFEPFIEFLDRKRFPELENEAQLLDRLGHKYSARRFALVLALDNPAFDFVVKNRSRLVPEVPLIFCGVNGFRDEMLQGQKGITGVLEADVPAETLDLALRLLPRTREIFVIHDYTDSGLAQRQVVEAAIPAYANRVSFRFADRVTTEELWSAVERLRPGTIVFFLGFVRDRSGRVLSSGEQFRAALTQRCPVPVFSPYGGTLKNLGLGGSLLTGRTQGEAAGRMALRVLGGEDIRQIPILKKSPTQATVEYEQMVRFGIPFSLLPAGTLVLHQPETLFTRFHRPILAALAFVPLLGLVVAGLLVEISRRHRIQTALAESEQRLRAIIQAEPECVKLLSPDATLLEMNPAGLSMIEAESASQVVGQPIWPLIAPDHHAAFRTLLEKVFLGESGTLEFEMIGLKGTRRWLETHAVPIRDPRDPKKVKAYLGVTRDVTEHKRSEQALRESEARHRALAENSPVGIWQTKPDGASLYINAAGCAIFEVEDPRQMAGKSYRDFYTPASIAIVQGEHAKRAQGITSSYEVEVVGAKGRRRNVVVRGAPLYGADGRVQSFIGTLTDVTDWKRAEATLREGEERFRQLAENIQEVFWMTDPSKNQMLYISPGYEQVWGRTCESLYASPRNWLEAICPEDRERVLSAALAKQALGTYSEEYRIIRPDGTQRWILDRAFPIRDVAGRVFRIAGVAEDITERKRAEEELRRSEARYRLLFESNPHPMWVYDVKSFAFLAVNDAAVAHYGYSRNEFLAMTLKDIRPPEDIPRLVERASSANKASFGSGGSWRHRKKDGSLIEVEITFHELRFEGRQARLVLANDVTERNRADAALKESQRFLEKAQEVGHIGSWIASAEGSGTLTWSNEVLRIFGVSRDAFDGRVETFFSLVHPDDRDKVREAIAAALAYPQPYAIDHRIVRPDGTICWVHEQADVTRDAEGAPMQLIGVVQDITKQKLLEEQLRQSQKLEAIGQLAGGVAHDFNNILTVIKGHASVALGKADLPGGLEDSLREILLASDRATNLTRQLLTFGRRQVMQPKNLDLTEVVDNMSRMLRRVLGEDILLEVQSSSNLPLVHADSGMIEQVLLNLAVNSRDAMPKGGRLSIHTHLATTDAAALAPDPEAVKGPFVCLRVSDNGSGIAAEDLPRIFDPFFTTKELGKGTGLGLATVYGIIKQHRGWIEVQSEVGRGTTFLIFLPGVSTKEEERNPKMEESKIPGGTERILLVEDEKSLRALVQFVLEGYGYRVWAAASGVEALKFWSEHRDEIDLLLTDMVMPDGISGRELSSRLRSDKPSLKVVFTTGYSPEIIEEGGVIEERVHFLQKPFHPTTLAQIVRECLDDPS